MIKYYNKNMSIASNLAYNLLLLMLKARGQLAKLCEPYSITSMQGLVLLLLQPKQSMAMNELSEVLGCDASNVTGLVDRMETQGLIERSSGEQDRRVKMIRLSGKGTKCRCVLMDGLEKVQVANLERLTLSEREKFKDLLKKLSGD
jgi:DNA-binding MarR family transcriptional regulator